MKELFDLFWTFAKIGSITFGGGYAMLPIIQREIVEKKKWATEEEVMDYYAVGQCTPGVIAVNTATFIGYKLRGIFGGIFATLGVVFPSLVIIMVIAAFLKNFAEFEIVKHAFGGIRVAVVALIISSVIKLWKSSVKNSIGLFLAAAAFVLGALLKLSPIYVVIGAAIVGVLTKNKGGEK
ncbi:chromate transporter [uncultured Clostridium sp.]|uniref:chromate transporter n=1 Tax=uncultured Clostridium sp. TaxID=59620 RepID=UPI0025F040A2|nr:chromate transporter [uncultured Clostridium sp.]